MPAGNAAEIWPPRAESLPTAMTMSRGWQPETTSGRFATEVGRPRRVASGTGVFGWVLLALLLGGAGAVGYALMRDPSGGRGTLAVPQTADPIAPTTPATPIPAKDPNEAAVLLPDERGHRRKPDGERVTRPDRQPVERPTIDKAMAKAEGKFRDRKWAAAASEYQDIFKDFVDELDKEPSIFAKAKMRMARVQIERGKLADARTHMNVAELSYLGSSERGEFLMVCTILQEGDDSAIVSRAKYVDAMAKYASTRSEAIERIRAADLDARRRGA